MIDAMSAELDTLTDLPNRNAFEKSFRAAFEGGGSLATMLIDIKDMRSLNDVYGHLTADQVIAEVARRLRAATHAGDFVARLGGDEFVVLATSVGDDEDDLAALEREVEDAISGEPIGDLLHVGVTIKSGLLTHPAELGRLDWS
jgi:diguanylate cyclase (GGDEF)-like protein